MSGLMCSRYDMNTGRDIRKWKLKKVRRYKKRVDVKACSGVKVLYEP